MLYEWDEDKRASNLEKHGLDFEDAMLVYDNRYKFEIPVSRDGEVRIAAFAYVFDVLAVLTLVVTARGERVRCISFRYAHEEERSFYYEWLANNFKE
ncbi:MAG TPA: BrnT family toxin [Desulfuromonadales bacterium]|nr:BrnT family toxin [Desulfuromonadales bacterium]